MPSTTNTVEINADPEEVWAVLADMPATRQWLPGVVAARMDGELRVCAMADGQEVHERISDVSPERRSYQFTHLKVPLPVRESHGTFTVTPGPGDATATVTLEASFEPLDPAAADGLADMIQGAFQQSLESLRRFVETKTAWYAA